MEQKEIDKMFDRLKVIDGMIFHSAPFIEYLRELQERIEQLEGEVKVLKEKV